MQNAIIQYLGIRSLQSFAHATTTVLSWHMQKFIVIASAQSRLKQDNISIDFAWKIISEMGQWPTLSKGFTLRQQGYVLTSQHGPRWASMDLSQVKMYTINYLLCDALSLRTCQSSFRQQVHKAGASMATALIKMLFETSYVTYDI